MAVNGTPILQLQDDTCHMESQCYLPPDTSECAPPKPQPVSWYLIYLPWRDERLS